MEESKRIRVVFKDDDILSETQKSDGLSRSWVLLKPHQHDTVSDVALHLLHAFQLHRSCPHGLILSTSGFVLPPFESTNILKDYEIVRVQKRKDILSIAGNNTTNDVEKLKAVGKQPVNSGLLLLANEEFDKERGGYESDEPEADDEEALLENVEHPSGSKRNRKRKSADKLQHSKQKKQRPDATGKTSNDVRTDKSQDFHKDAEFRKKKSVSSEEKKDDSIAGDREQRIDEVQENSKVTEDAKIAPEEKKKVPSRSARRTYAKRKWLREMAKIQKQNANCESEGLRNWKEDKAKSGRIEVDSRVKGLKKWKKHQADVEGKLADCQPKGLLHWTPQDNWIVKGKKRKQRSQNDNFPIPSSQNDDGDEQQIQTGHGHEQPNEAQGDSLEPPGQKKAAAQESKNQSCEASDILNQESGEEHEVVPIVIRPGHIRFEPLGKEHAEQSVQKDHFPQETCQWNGITSKKKGQQWGKEDRPFIPRNDHKIPNEEDSELSNKKETHADEGTDLDKLAPLLGMPKKGDIIAYRVLELSSSWTPELSAYRFGKVSWYNPDSNQTMLLPVPEYPIVLKKADEDEAAQLDNSLYKEDGSLEIDFSSLIDVRIFNNGKSEPGNDSLKSMSEGPAGIVNVPKTALPSGSDKPTILPSQDATGSDLGKEMDSPAAENVGVDIWDQLSETLNAKKDQLSKENGWGSSPPLKVRVSHENIRASTPKKVQDNTVGKKSYPGGKWVKNAQRAQPSQENSSSSGSKSWSYRALRGSALGPTMAILRSNKD
ncbi:hypothetical protein ACS0TY_010809 [Phlomoides rotata]